MSINCLLPQPSDNSDGDDRKMSMHLRFIQQAENSESEVMWIGDSIIEQLLLTPLWSEKISALHSINFGIGGDRVENVLWRLLNGELNFNTPPKVIVIFVGTNNTNSTKDQIFSGILNIIEVIRKRLGPSIALVLPTLLPRGRSPNPARVRNFAINNLLMETFPYIDDNNVHIVPIHENALQLDGTISPLIMHDYLHLTREGYTRIFTPVYEHIRTLLKQTSCCIEK